MTDVRTFKAASMQEALEVVRRELGSEAVILHTRQVSHRRMLPWLKERQEVEITAGSGVNIRPNPAARRENTAVEQHREARTPLASLAVSNAYQAVSNAHQASSIVALAAQTRAKADDGNVELEIGAHARNLLANAATHGHANTANAPQNFNAPAAMPATGNATGDDSHAKLAEKLNSIEKMVENLNRARHVGGHEEIPNELFHLYTDLIDADVEDELARDLIFRLRRNATPGQLGDTAAAKTLLTAMVESEIKCASPITAVPGKRKVVALVGPTGVGKTTTIAKLAANFRLRDGVKMGLVTVDTYRIAAVEQLRTYAEIIDLPMKVVTSPLEMRRALDELTGLDLVLIDTAGRSPRDELQIKELKSLLAEANVDEVHLVMSLTASMRSIQATAEKFSAANTTSIILTKLDEAAGTGALLSVSRKVPLPMSYLTTGQDVPDDIEPANARRVARLVLGQDRLFD